MKTLQVLKALATVLLWQVVAFLIIYFVVINAWKNYKIPVLPVH